MRNPLQEQLLKAGLVKKQKADEAARALERRRDGKAPPPPAAEQVNAEKLRAERVERDRQLAAEQKLLAREKEVRAQVRQIVETHKVASRGEQGYRFTDGDKIKEILVDEAIRKQLVRGQLAIVRIDDSYALLPRAAADMVHERSDAIVVDHGRNSAAAAPVHTDEDAAYYAKFVVPDDLMW